MLIGVDIGGTNIRCAIMSNDGIITDKMEYRNDSNLTPEESLKKLIVKINWWKEIYNIKSVGIGCPGPLNIDEGILINPPNLKKWWGFNLKKYVEEETQLEVATNNDANVAGLCEAILGSGKGYKSVYYMTVSTGVGGAYINNGKVVNGANNNTGEIGNLIIRSDIKSTGSYGESTLEGRCSGTSIEAITSKEYNVSKPAKEIFKDCYSGKEYAQNTIEKWAIELATGISLIYHIVDPEVIVLGGSVINNNIKQIPLIKKYLEEKVLPNTKINLQVAKYSGDAGLIGAAMLSL